MYGTTTRTIYTAPHVPAGTRVLVTSLDEDQVRFRHPTAGFPVYVEHDAIAPEEDEQPEPGPRTWEIPDEPVGVDYVWSTDGQGHPVRWFRTGSGWHRTGVPGPPLTWSELLGHASPVTELPRCQDGTHTLADTRWPGPCTRRARSTDDVQAGRFSGLYCPPCRIRAAADQVQDEPLQWPLSTAQIGADHMTHVARLLTEIEDGRVDEVGHFLLEHIAEHGTDGIDAQALARRVLDRVDED